MVKHIKKLCIDIISKRNVCIKLRTGGIVELIYMVRNKGLHHPWSYYLRTTVGAIFFAWTAVSLAYSAALKCDLKRSESLWHAGRYPAALEAVQGCGENPQAQKIIGQIYHEQYAPDSAILYLKRAFDKGIHDDALLTALAEAFLWKKNFRNATEIMDAVKEKGSADYLKVIARKHEILGEFDQAVKAYDQAIALEKLPYGTMERKAIIFSWMKKFPESIALFDEILKVKIVSRPLKVRCMVRKAEVQSWQNQFDLALTGLDKALVLDSKNIDARLVKGRILEWKGDYAQARSIYQEIRKLEPGNDQVKLRLEKLAWAEGKGE